jgi:ferredoxin
MSEPATRRLEITVDPHRCVGSMMCVMVAAKTFALDEGGQAEVIDAAGDPADDVVNAAVQCPMIAISVRDADTGEVLFPT